MWKAVVGHNVSMKVESQGDDWDTDPDFVNDISEKEQRWGAKTIEGSGRGEHIDIHQLRSKVSEEHESLKKKELEAAPKASYGYGGTFGTEKDRMDKAALGHEYVAEIGMHSSQTDAAKGFGGKYGVQKDRADKSALGFDYKGEVERHTSQKDYAVGFGGKYGVQKDRQDKSALSWAHKEEVKPHESQTDYAVGFGGKFGVQKDRQDKSALDWAHKEEVKPHESQTDYAVGFGGKFGVQKDRQDKSAFGWAHKEELKPHESQTDYAKGFGGRYGVQKDRVDKSAAGFSEMEAPVSSYEKTKPVEAASSGAGSLRQRFENMAKVAEEENQKRADAERTQRQARDQKERQVALEQQKKREEKHFKEASQNADPSNKEEPAPSLPLVPKMVCPEARLPPMPPVAQPGVAEEEGEDRPPGPPTWHLDTHETPRKLPALPPPMQQPLCTETSDDGEDYDDVHPEPPSLQEEEEDEDAGGEYEDIPPHFSHEEGIYDEDMDAGQDYEEIPDMIPSGSGVRGPSSEAEGCVYEAVKESLSAVALYDYQGDGDDEISFYPGDTITDIERVNEGWWHGRCHAKEGLFPANYVDLLQ